MPGPIEIQYCITQREPLVLVHNDGGVLGLLTEKHLRALCPAWLDNVGYTATIRTREKHYVYGFIPDRYWPSSNNYFLREGLEWVEVQSLRGKDMTRGLRRCLNNFLDVEYHIPVIMDRDGRVLLENLLGGGFSFPESSIAAPPPYCTELVRIRVPHISMFGLHCQVIFHNPSPNFITSVLALTSCGPNFFDWVKPVDIGSFMVKADGNERNSTFYTYWSSTLSELQYYLLDEVLNVPDVLAKVTRFGPASVSVYDLIT
jgi:hypothetical protein